MMKRSEAIIAVTDSVTTMFLTMFDPEIGVEHKLTLEDGTEKENAIDALGHEAFMQVSSVFAEQVVGALENAGLIFEEG